jgi:hypothetical protein
MTTYLDNLWLALAWLTVLSVVLGVAGWLADRAGGALPRASVRTLRRLARHRRAPVAGYRARRMPLDERAEGARRVC